MRPFIYGLNGLKAVNLASAPDWMWTPFSVRATAQGDASLSESEAFGAVGDVYRGVVLRSNAVTKMPRHFYELTGGAEVEADDPRLAILGNFTDILWRTEASLVVSGASYLAKLDATTRAMRWFLTSTITPDIDQHKGLIGFRRSVGGQPYFTLDQLCYVWLPSPFAELGPGPGPLQVALEDAGVVRNIALALSAFFERGMVQPVLIYQESEGSIAPMPLSPPQKDDLKAFLRKIVGGVRRAFALEVIDRKLGKLDLSSSLKDALPDGLSEQQSKKVIKTLGIPYSLVFSDAANYATAQQDWRNLYDQAVVPDCELIQAALNKQFFNPILGMELYFAPEELEVYQEDETARATSLSALILAGTPVDVAMDLLGYDLDEEDDARIRLKALVTQGASYEAAVAYILEGADELERERVARVLALFKPAPAPPELLPAPPPAQPLAPGISAEIPDAPAPDTAAPGTKAVTLKPRHGAMIGFFLSTHDARQIAPADDELPEGAQREDTLHLTLAFLGDTGDLEANRQTIQDIVDEFAVTHGPISGTVNGVGKLNAVEGGSADAIYASFDAVPLARFRTELVSALGQAGIAVATDHGFIPHITLFYAPPSDTLPEMTLPATPITFPALVLAWSNEHYVSPLKGEEGYTIRHAEDLVTPAKADLLRWQRKALKRFKAGKGAACEFESASIGDSLKGAIAGALETAEDETAVRAAFSQALTWGMYP